MSVIAGALYIVKSRVGYKRSFEHDSLDDGKYRASIASRGKNRVAQKKLSLW